MKYKKISLKNAFIRVYKKRRITTALNPSFFKQLISYEKKLFGKNSVKMVTILGKTVPDFIVKEYPEFLNSEASQEESIDDKTISVISQTI